MIKFKVKIKSLRRIKANGIYNGKNIRYFNTEKDFIDSCCNSIEYIEETILPVLRETGQSIAELDDNEVYALSYEVQSKT